MKRFAVLMLTLLLMFTVLVGCGNGKGKGSADGGTFTGVIEEKKDFMIIVTAEDGKSSHIFNLDGITCDANTGDKVTVTYTGDLEDIDSTLMATKIEKAG